METETSITQSVLPYHHTPRVPGATLFSYYRNPLHFLQHLAHSHGDVVRFRLGPNEIYLINDPELIRSVLVTHDRKFAKGRGLRVAERLLGQGLLTSEGEFHCRQRRLAQPAFHRRRIEGYAQVMADYSQQWQQAQSDDQEIDMVQEMRGLTLRITAKTLFDTEVAAEVQEISDALTEALQLFGLAILPFAERLERFVPFLTRRFERARARLDATVFRMIAERRSSCEDRGDLLSMLLLAQDEEGEGGGMTDIQLRDEAMTLLLAGHETTANALAWTWSLLSQNPDAEKRLHAELDEVLAGRVPMVEDLPLLPYTRAVFSEAMRLYPPAWLIARTTMEECPLGSFVLPRGSQVFLSQWVTHHDPRFYPEPLRFEPARFHPDAVANRPRFAYYPFGGGSRICIGEQFARIEAVIVLATIASGWKFEASSGQRVVPIPSLTLRPKHKVRMRARYRKNI